jgi:hypothetical protein
MPSLHDLQWPGNAPGDRVQRKQSMPMTLTIKFSDEQAEILQAKAAGLSVEAWIQKLPELQGRVEKPLQTAANIILESMKDVQPDVMAQMPTDGASQHDHYIYGWPKRDV